MNYPSNEDLRKQNDQQAARIAKLEAALRDIVGDMYDCKACDGTGIEEGEENIACERCGGYGFNPGGDIREHMIDARNILKGKAS